MALSCDPELDFTSLLFNPLKALNAPNITLPCPDVQPCDNLEQYISIIKGKRAAVSVKETTPTTTNPVQPIQHKNSKTILDFMLVSAKDGPFSLLHQCHINYRYVHVLIRHSMGLRGYCHGYVIAFDRHMNMVLGDVSEWYTPLLTFSNNGKMKKKSKKGKKSLTSCQETKEVLPVVDSGIERTCNYNNQKWACTRYVNQLFIRGDNVILIRPIYHNKIK